MLGIFLDIAATAALLVWFFMGGKVSDDGTALFLPPVLIYMIWSHGAAARTKYAPIRKQTQRKIQMMAK